jgi:thiamine-monophosphate kinase
MAPMQTKHRKTGAVTPKAERQGEFDLIANVLAPLADERALGLTDDAAILPQASGLDTVVSTDTLVTGVHFLKNEDPDIIARRLLRVNLSDIAAMAARPFGYFLNLTLSPDIGDDWLIKFAQGLAADQKSFGIRLMGGDTTRTPGELTLSVTMLGEVPSGKAVRRSTAEVGDRIFVSGTIGDAALGLVRLKTGAGADDALVRRYQLPDPRVSLGTALRGIVNAMADVSDGLVADLGHICEASGLAATIEAEAVPLSNGARTVLESDPSEITGLLTGGDDYELVFTAPREQIEAVKAAAAGVGVEATEIGRMEEGGGEVSVIDRDGADISPENGGYRHF